MEEMFSYLRNWNSNQSCRVLPQAEGETRTGYYIYSMASKPINIRWIRTGFQPK